MREGDGLSPEVTMHSEREKAGSLKDLISSLKNFFQLFNADAPNLSYDTGVIKRQLDNLRLQIAETDESISPETNTRLIKLEGLLEYFVVLAEKTPVVQKGIVNRVMSGGVSAKRDPIAELGRHLFEYLGETEIK